MANIEAEKKEWEQFEDIDISQSVDKNPNIEKEKKWFNLLAKYVVPKNKWEKITPSDINNAFSTYISTETNKAGTSGDIWKNTKIQELGKSIEQEIRATNDPREKLKKIALFAQELDRSLSTDKAEKNQWAVQFQKIQTDIDKLHQSDLARRIVEFQKMISESQVEESKKRKEQWDAARKKLEETCWSTNPEAATACDRSLNNDWPGG